MDFTIHLKTAKTDFVQYIFGKNVFFVVYMFIN